MFQCFNVASIGPSLHLWCGPLLCMAVTSLNLLYIFKKCILYYSQYKYFQRSRILQWPVIVLEALKKIFNPVGKYFQGLGIVQNPCEILYFPRPRNLSGVLSIFISLF